MRKNAQVDSFDKDTMNKIWNIFSHYLKKGNGSKDENKTVRNCIEFFFESVYIEILQKPKDEVGVVYDKISKEYSFTPFFELNDEQYFFLRNLLLGNSRFSEKMDVIELFVKNLNDQNIIVEFNKLFRELLVSYRVRKDGTIIRVDSDEEYKEIEAAAKECDFIDKAVKKLYDRKNPDYENAIKEAISAVEEVCKSNGNAKFSDCLKDMKEKHKLHPALIESLLKLYGFCSDAKGIRHSGNSISNIDFEEAKLIVVMCSAIVNYLKIKETKINN